MCIHRVVENKVIESWGKEKNQQEKTEIYVVENSSHVLSLLLMRNGVANSRARLSEYVF